MYTPAQASPETLEELRQHVQNEFTRIATSLLTLDSPATMHTVASLPSPNREASIVYVTDETGGAVLAFSDGTSWRRVTDRAVVS